MNDSSMRRREFLKASGAATAGLAAGMLAVSTRAAEKPPEVARTRSYNSAMEYRRLGKTGLWVSAVCLGGHWKRINKVIPASAEIGPYTSPEREADLGPFLKNREEVVNRCIEKGINLIDFAGDSEAEVYCKVLRGKRDAVFCAYSHPASELRVPENRTAKKLLELFKAGLARCGLESVDIWRLMALERGGRHTQADVDAMLEALAAARKAGLCRFTGLSTHDRAWAKMLIETYPDIVQVLVTPYTPASEPAEGDSLFDAVKKHDVGVLGIKPFASNAIFQGDGAPDGPHVEEDDRRARLAVRQILKNPSITAPIPGLVSTHQVDNMARAVAERRELDGAERAELRRMCEDMWARLPAEYEWLHEWRLV